MPSGSFLGGRGGECCLGCRSEQVARGHGGGGGDGGEGREVEEDRKGERQRKTIWSERITMTQAVASYGVRYYVQRN
eukprot:2184653-Pleurochrysis_carterae.AAC.3